MSELARPSRIERLPGSLADLVNRVAPPQIDDCLQMLSVMVIDVVDLGSAPSVRETLAQWREQGRVSPATRERLDAAYSRFEVEAATAHHHGDIDAQRVAFTRARALDCLGTAVRAELSGRTRLIEASYEAVTALGAAAGVVAVVVEFVV